MSLGSIADELGDDHNPVAAGQAARLRHINGLLAQQQAQMAVQRRPPSAASSALPAGRQQQRAELQPQAAALRQCSPLPGSGRGSGGRWQQLPGRAAIVGGGGKLDPHRQLSPPRPVSKSKLLQDYPKTRQQRLQQLAQPRLVRVEDYEQVRGASPHVSRAVCAVLGWNPQCRGTRHRAYGASQRVTGSRQHAVCVQCL
jgi:hypothetical protein